jgi:hypothetical protein
MLLPNADAAVVSKAKIVDYLLNPQHPDGAGKATFFESLGFTAQDWQVLAGALQQMVASSSVIKSVESIHGAKYIIDGAIQAPGRRSANIRSVWIIDRGKEIPRLVTAYPHESKP